MRDLILGIMLGALLVVFPEWMRAHRMDNYIDLVMLVLVSGILVLLLWRPLLKLISKRFPRLYIWINEINASTPITDEYRRKAYEKKNKKDGSTQKQHYQSQETRRR